MRGKPGSVLLLLGTLGVMLTARMAAGQAVDQLITAEQRRIQQAQESQDKVDAIVEKTRSRIDEYRSVMKEVDGLVVYNTLLQRQIEDQESELSDLRNSIDQVTVIERQILPLMTRMIDGLERFIALDVPFLQEQRTARVASLRQLLQRSDVTTAEQFRNVMQAWQDEDDYGRTIQAYNGVLQINGSNREVDFLRIGRVALIYQTPDGELSGAWDQKTRQWVSVGNEYREAIRTGLRIAHDQAAPDLLMLPIAAPEESS
jgi:Protein of unknown function (DUF3450)